MKANQVKNNKPTVAMRLASKYIVRVYTRPLAS
jgi:hypothetical protein